MTSGHPCARLVMAFLAGTIVLSGCSGPKVALEIGSKSVSVNVDFGKPAETLAPPAAQAPPPAFTLQQTEGGIVIVPIAGDAPRQPPPPPAEACPSASPFSVPAKEATNYVDSPAPNGSYPFRAAGQLKRGTNTFPYPGTINRRISGARSNSDGTLQFDVTETVLGATTVTTYMTDSTQVALKKVVRTEGSITTTFEPIPAVMILPLPPQSSDPVGQPVYTWRSAGTDPRSGKSLSVEGTVRPRERVDACGQFLDSWVADTSQRSVGPLEDLTIVSRTNIATQYGGMIVADQIRASGTLGGAPYESTLRVIINSAPQG